MIDVVYREHVDAEVERMLRCSSVIQYSKLTRPSTDGRLTEWKIKVRKCIVICLLFSILSIVYFGFFYSDYSYSLTTNRSKLTRWVPNIIEDEENDDIEVEFKTASMSFDDILNDKYRFDINSHDVMVFLHVQKTGGTSFGRHLVQDLDLQRPCTCQRKQKRCYCLRPTRNENWLFSRYSTGWKCGLHADWTELTNCVNSELDKNEGEPVKRRYFYITLIREPVSRLLSEFKHVQRGATWKNSRHWCGGRLATKEELPKCYNGSSWMNVSLDEFLNCRHNLGLNRQARMMSDLSLVGCYNRSYMVPAERDRIILASAKHNLKSMAFFALTEFQKIGQYTFEEVFNLRFAVPFSQFNSTRSSDYISKLKPEQIAKIRKLNKLDLELYEFAKKLMYRRFTRLRQRDENFEERWKHLGELPVQTEFNWDKEIEPDPVTKKIVNTR